MKIGTVFLVESPPITEFTISVNKNKIILALNCMCICFSDHFLWNFNEQWNDQMLKSQGEENKNNLKHAQLSSV